MPKKKISGGKVLLALCTGGLSLPITGIKSNVKKKSAPKRKTRPLREKIASTTPTLDSYFPNSYSQDTHKSVLTQDGKYDLRRFSRHDANIINEVLSVTQRKYPKEFKAIGLANEAYVLTYKPRYVIFDIIIIRYENSENPLDRLAVSFAYESKGAFYRGKAIEYFESAIKYVDNSTLNRFSSYSAYQTYLNFSSLYEREHNYKKAISCMKKARASKGAAKEYCTDKISELEKKMENPPKVRTRKKPDDYNLFEQNVRLAATAFNSGIFTEIELNARPNK